MRRDAGMFDVSHMTIVDLHGAGVRHYLTRLLANNVDKLKTKGRALYSCMLNSRGGVIDDLIAYYMSEDWYRLIVNAATRDKDMKWLQATAAKVEDVSIAERSDLAMIAAQGPHARDKVFAALGEATRELAEDLRPFSSARVGEMLLARTGYTGEDGFEIILPAKAAPFTWQMLAEAGIAPAGLGARDTLRLEAGMNLYGTDMDEHTSPLVSGLAWTVAWEPEERAFFGRDALAAEQAAGPTRRLVGLVLDGKGVLRNHQRVAFGEHGEGVVTSGGFAPTLQRSIALARVPAAVAIGEPGTVDLRGRAESVSVVKTPFVRQGKSLID